MNVAGVARSLSRKFKTVDGQYFIGTLYKPVNYMPLNNFDSPHQMLRVASNSNVSAGTIMITGTGRRYLLADHIDFESAALLAKSFRMIEMRQQVAWTRQVTTPDTVTGLAKISATPTALGNIWLSYEHPRATIDAIKVAQPTYRIATNAALQLGDMVDGDKRVIQVHEQLGVTYATVK